MGKHSGDKDRRKEKKAKKAKKKSKREKHDEKGQTGQTNEKIPATDANSTTSAPEATPQVEVAVTVPLSTNQGGDNDASDKAGPVHVAWQYCSSQQSYFGEISRHFEQNMPLHPPHGSLRSSQ